MIALVSVETVLLVLLVVLVAALLRSHAEILRRLGPDGAPARDPHPLVARDPLVAPPPTRDRSEIAAPEIAGATHTGDAIQLAFEGSSTLLAFLSSGCTSCATFWATLGEGGARLGEGGATLGKGGATFGEGGLPANLETVIVTRGPDREQRSKIRSLAPPSIPVVMSSQAWEDYAVPGSPYFVLIDDGEVRGEGVATNWNALTSLVGDAIEDQREAQTVDARLAAAGIGPDHPSLFPGERA